MTIAGENVQRPRRGVAIAVVLVASVACVLSVLGNLLSPVSCPAQHCDIESGWTLRYCDGENGEGRVRSRE